MAFNVKNFDPTGSGSKGGAPQVATYTTTDATATVEAANYFNSVQDTLPTGTLLYVVMSDNTKFYKVLNTDGVITLPLGLVFL